MNQPEKYIPKKRLVKKIGRTLVVKSKDNNELNESLFNNYKGLVKIKVAHTKLNNLVFLIFDTPPDALSALINLKKKSNLLVNFSYYKIFFTIKGLNTNDTSDYNQVKKDLIEFVNNEVQANVLYCKLYCKNNKYIGCGNLTVDTLDSMLMLLSKNSNLKDFSFKSYTGSFYKFTEKKIKK